MLEGDDPYNFLALQLITRFDQIDLARIMVDDEYVKGLIIKEIRGQDLAGPFSDAIVTSILENKQRMEMCHEQDKFALYLFTKLDIKRMRDKLVEYLDKLEIKL